jgi:GH24 family phage-related lysozyme (muramidase)
VKPTTAQPTTAQLAAALIAVFEGPERLTAFRDGGGVLTIGRGHTGRDVTEGLTITHDQAVAFFAQDQQPLLTLVAGMPPVGAAAYVSFGYKCGRGALHAVLNGLDKVSNPLHTTDRHGNVEPGLVSRRLLESLPIASA